MAQDAAQPPAALRWWPRPGPATDWIDMDLVIRELDDPIRKAVTAAKVISAVRPAQAEGAAKIAQIVSGRKG